VAQRELAYVQVELLREFLFWCLLLCYELVLSRLCQAIALA
jgi:hypothetical protein